ncbi:MAG TPA: Lrp/AsnC family transcriptional regulator [Nitrososphaeraceae archaeon]|nr:Lrp/AsnC family transcriptional regulator [Nitrososphaeraceae archaeon]
MIKTESDENANEIDYIADLQKNTNNRYLPEKGIKIVKKRPIVHDYNDEEGNNSGEYSKSNSTLPTLITADKFDVLIIKELLEDPSITTLEISIKLGITLGIANKKRRLIESKVLQTKYYFDLQKLGLGFRFADVFADITDDKVNDFTNQLYASSLDKSILKVIKVKNPSDGVCIKTLYQDSEELFLLMDQIKSYPAISNVCFSEQVEVVGDNTLDVIFNILSADSKNNK